MTRSHRESVLREAIELTCGDRQSDYGDPYDGMKHAADIFNARTMRKGDRALEARDVAILLSSLKEARRFVSPNHRDSYVDDAAYIGIEYECAMAERAAKVEPLP